MALATKIYTDAVVMGLNWNSTKPSAPVTGDCYFDQNTQEGFIWQGIAWVKISGEPSPTPPFLPPTAEQLDKHPALKEAWEEFLVLKRLIGV